MTHTSSHSRPLARWNDTSCTASVALAGGEIVVAAHRHLEPRDEAAGRAAAAVGREVLLPEAQDRVEVLAAFLAAERLAGGEVGELVGEGAARRGLLHRAKLVEHGPHLGPVHEPAGAGHAHRHARRPGSAVSNGTDCALVR